MPPVAQKGGLDHGVVVVGEPGPLPWAD
jgi:hypothetical protein